MSVYERKEAYIDIRTERGQYRHKNGERPIHVSTSERRETNIGIRTERGQY